VKSPVERDLCGAFLFGAILNVEVLIFNVPYIKKFRYKKDYG
jgi:hypothetical protein